MACSSIFAGVTENGSPTCCKSRARDADPDAKTIGGDVDGWSDMSVGNDGGRAVNGKARCIRVDQTPFYHAGSCRLSTGIDCSGLLHNGLLQVAAEQYIHRFSMGGQRHKIL